MLARWEPVAVEDWVRTDESRSGEPLGTKEKFWVTGPDGHEYLFKFARTDSDGTNVRGEDWAEWAVHQLAELIGVPTAVIVSGTYGGRRGILSRAVWGQERERLIHGNELLARADATYDAAEPRQNPGYTIEAVRAALADVSAPLSCQPPVITGFDAWAGYLMLDAWVAGRDRHHENWAAVNREGVLILAPSFDHGNALGFQVPKDRVAVLAADDVALTHWAQRGTSVHFAGRPSLVDLARRALDRAGAGVQDFWRTRLAETRANDIAAIFEQIPDALMSDTGRTFRVRLLEFNKERIVDDR